VKSVKRIPYYSQTSSTATTAPYPAYVQDLKAQNVAESSSSSTALPVAVGAGLLTAVGVTTAFAVYRRRTHTASR
jgi:phospholipase C